MWVKLNSLNILVDFANRCAWKCAVYDSFVCQIFDVHSEKCCLKMHANVEYFKQNRSDDDIIFIIFNGKTKPINDECVQMRNINVFPCRCGVRNEPGIKLMRKKYTKAIIYTFSRFIWRSYLLSVFLVYPSNKSGRIREYELDTICSKALAYCCAMLVIVIFVINKTHHNVCRQLEENAKWSPLDIYCFILVNYFSF